MSDHSQSMGEGELVRLVRQGPLALLALNRPDKRNALTPEMLERLLTLLEAPEVLEARAIVLCGEGGVFCSGFDMRLVHADSRALSKLLTVLTGVVRAMRACPRPIVAAAHGAAVAGGCAVLAGADVVVTDRAAKLGYPVTRLGISPAVTVPGLLGMMSAGGARERTLDSGLISGEEAARTGLAHVCCDQPEDVIPKATRLAQHLAEKPGSAVAAMKGLLARLGSGQEDFELALRASLGLVGSGDQLARVAALWPMPGGERSGPQAIS